MCEWLSDRLRYGKTGNKKMQLVHAAMLQNKLNSDVAFFTSPIKPVLQQIRFFTGLKVASKTRCCKKIARFCCPFYRSLSNSAQNGS